MKLSHLLHVAILACLCAFAADNVRANVIDDGAAVNKSEVAKTVVAADADSASVAMADGKLICNVADRVTATVARRPILAPAKLPEAPVDTIDHVPL